VLFWPIRWSKLQPHLLTVRGIQTIDTLLEEFIIRWWCHWSYYSFGDDVTEGEMATWPWPVTSVGDRLEYSIPAPAFPGRPFLPWPVTTAVVLLCDGPTTCCVTDVPDREGGIHYSWHSLLKAVPLLTGGRTLLKSHYSEGRGNCSVFPNSIWFVVFRWWYSGETDQENQRLHSVTWPVFGSTDSSVVLVFLFRLFGRCYACSVIAGFLMRKEGGSYCWPIYSAAHYILRNRVLGLSTGTDELMKLTDWKGFDDPIYSVMTLFWWWPDDDLRWWWWYSDCQY